MSADFPNTWSPPLFRTHDKTSNISYKRRMITIAKMKLATLESLVEEEEATKKAQTPFSAAQATGSTSAGAGPSNYAAVPTTPGGDPARPVRASRKFPPVDNSPHLPSGGGSGGRASHAIVIKSDKKDGKKKM